MNTSLILYNKKSTKMKRPSCSINAYINAFLPMLTSLGCKKEDNNIVFAGVNALKLHGLFMNREANDLDVVLFQPTQNQIDYLTNISLFQISKPFGHNGDYLPNEQEEILSSLRQKSMKFEHNGLFLDVLLTKDELPHDLLYYKAFETMWKIQNIALNIEAKNSYSLSRERDGMSLYRRSKDMEDLIDLKNSNFNFNK